MMERHHRFAAMSNLLEKSGHLGCLAAWVSGEIKV